MKKNLPHKVAIADIIAPIIGSRDGVDVVAKKIEKIRAKSVELDFTSVEFISRSAAHEFLLMKEKFQQQKHISLFFSNTNEQVASMLRSVAANRALPKSSEYAPQFQRVSFKKLFATQLPVSSRVLASLKSGRA